MQANEKKRPKEEKDIAHRLRPFARLQTAEDYEAFVADTICTHFLPMLSAIWLTWRRRGGYAPETYS